YVAGVIIRAVGPQPLRLPMGAILVMGRGNLKGCGPTDWPDKADCQLVGATSRVAALRIRVGATSGVAALRVGLIRLNIKGSQAQDISVDLSDTLLYLICIWIELPGKGTVGLSIQIIEQSSCSRLYQLSIRH